MIDAAERERVAREWIRSFQIDGMFIYQRDVDSLAATLEKWGALCANEALESLTQELQALAERTYAPGADGYKEFEKGLRTAYLFAAGAAQRRISRRSEKTIPCPSNPRWERCLVLSPEKGVQSVSETREQQARELAEKIWDWGVEWVASQSEIEQLLARALAACALEEAKMWKEQTEHYHGWTRDSWGRERIAQLERAAGEGKS